MDQEDDLRAPPTDRGPALSQEIRTRLGRQLQDLYEPIIDEGLDPRLSDLIAQLEAMRPLGA